MATEHHIDLASGTAHDREIPDEDVPQHLLQARAEQREKEDALARLRLAALENGDLRDILTLLGY